MAVGVINFPTSLDDLDTLIRAENNAITTLASGISAGATTIPLTSATKFTTSGIATIIDNPASPTLIEIFTYTGKSSNDLTGAGRGAYGTTASAFSAGATVVMRPVARHHTALVDAIIAIETKLGISAHIKGYPKTIEVNTATTNSTGAGPDTLHSFSLPSNSLAANGDYVEVEYSGTFAADDDNKAIRATFGGTEYINRTLGATDIDGNVGWVVRATIVRLSTTSVRVSAVLCANLLIGDSANVFTGTSGNGGIMIASNLDITGLSDLTANATTMACQSLGVNAADVSQRLSVIKLVQR